MKIPSALPLSQTLRANVGPISQLSLHSPYLLCSLGSSSEPLSLRLFQKRVMLSP